VVLIGHDQTGAATLGTSKERDCLLILCLSAFVSVELWRFPHQRGNLANSVSRAAYAATIYRSIIQYLENVLDSLLTLEYELSAHLFHLHHC